MNILDEHIRGHLQKYLDRPSRDFSEIFARTQSATKFPFKNVLIYVNHLLDNVLSEDALKVSHFHFEGLHQNHLQVLAEFISIKFFFIGLHKDTGGESAALEKRMARTDVLIKQLGTYPEGVKGGSRKDKKIKEKKAQLRVRKAFYKEIQSMNSSASLLPKSLINVSQKIREELEGLFFMAPFACSVDDLQNCTYVLMNDSLHRDEIDRLVISNDNSVLNSIEHIVVFDCEQKVVHRSFQYNELLEWNRSGTNFKNLILFTFSDEFKIAKLSDRLERVRMRFYPTVDPKERHCYTVLPSELSSLLLQSDPKAIEVNFTDDFNLKAWDDFKQLVRRFEDLYELQSIKLCSIYSLALSNELSEIIIEGVFGNDGFSFVTDNVRDTLAELSNESKQELKGCLRNVLSHIERSNWPVLVGKLMSNRIAVIMPSVLVNSEKFYRSLLKVLCLEPKQVFTWNSIDSAIDKEMVILDYRDSGQFPFRIRPSLQESTFSKSPRITALFLSFLFEVKFNWTQYSIEKYLWSILGHPIRVSSFEWNELRKRIEERKPTYENNVDWDQERELNIIGQGASVRVKFEGVARFKTYRLSDLFVVRRGDDTIMNVAPLDSILEDSNEEQLYMQLLDSLHSEINIYERIANPEREKRELEVIRERLNLMPDTIPASWWKLLLERQVHANGLDLTYNQFKKKLEDKGMRLVSMYTFEQSWIEPSSKALVPREKRVFSFICDELGLPRTYYRIMLRLKNAEKQRNRRSGQQMDRLLTDLVNDGCFNEKANVEAILLREREKYLSDHDLDEIGIPVEQFQQELSALVSLLKPSLNLMRVEGFEKSV